MLNPTCVESLTSLLSDWIDENSDADWWTDAVGYVSPDTATRLANIVALTLQEGRESADHDETSRD